MIAYRFTTSKTNLSNTEKTAFLIQAERKIIQLALDDEKPSVSIDDSVRMTGITSDLTKLINAYGIAIDQDKNGSTDSTSNSIINEKITVIITSYNYGHYLPEAIDSVLNQIYMPDEIILSDDASTDLTPEIMQHYAKQYPDLIKVNINKENMGIEAHFNKVVAMAKGDYICILGADNRMPAHYIKEQLMKIKSDPKIGVVYTDFALFGNRAKNVFDNFFNDFKGHQVAPDTYTIIFPDFNDKSKKILDSGMNFIHGSSMYRKEAFNAVGGYGTRAGVAEDQQFFSKILNNGWLAVKAKNVFLEYRQHSQDQANMQFSYFSELKYLREMTRIQSIDYKALLDDNKRLESLYNNAIKSSAYRVGMVITWPLRLLKQLLK